MRALKKIDWEATEIDLESEVIYNEHKTKIKHIYCKHWDEARLGLIILKDAVKKPLAKLIIEIAIRIGNSIYQKNCYEKQ